MQQVWAETVSFLVVVATLVAVRLYYQRAVDSVRFKYFTWKGICHQTSLADFHQFLAFVVVANNQVRQNLMLLFIILRCEF
jgi:hypothetical protein